MYQPAGKPPGGTSSVPSGINPRSIRAASTPITGILTRSGVDRLIASAGFTAAGVTLRAVTVGPATLGAAAADSLEQPEVATPIVARRAVAAGISPRRVRRGRPKSLWWRMLVSDRPQFPAPPSSGDDRSSSNLSKQTLAATGFSAS